MCAVLLVPVVDLPSQQTLPFASTSRLLVSSARRSTVDDRAFTVARAHVCNTLQHLRHSRPSANDLKLGFSENHHHHLNQLFIFIQFRINLEAALLLRQV